MQYKPSCYNVYFEYNNSFYIYNTLYVSLVQLEKKYFDSLKGNFLQKIPEDILYGLYKQKFLVDARCNEVDSYLWFYNSLRYGGQAKLLSVTIIPSYACNLACPYCLQGQDKQNKAMSTDDVENVLKFVDSRIAASHIHGVPISKVNARTYGGEPMLQKESIVRYYSGMNDIARKYGCEIHNSMTSNFTLLDDGFLNLIEKYRISVQVSVDGTREEHDSRRIYHNGAGTYDIIMKNLQRMKNRNLESLITLRINLDKDNTSSAEQVMEDVHEFSEDVFFGYLESFRGFNDGCTNCIEKNNFTRAELTEKLNVIMRKYKYRVPEDFGKLAPCALNVENKFFVDCHMNVYKCELAINQPELSVGIIDDGGNFIPNHNYYMQMQHSPEKMPECLNCRLLPMCGGGCAAKAYIESGAHDGNLNRKYCMCNEEALLTYLKSYIRRLANQ